MIGWAVSKDLIGLSTDNKPIVVTLLLRVV